MLVFLQRAQPTKRTISGGEMPQDKYRQERKRLRREKIRQQTEARIHDLDILKQQGSIGPIEHNRRRWNLLEQERLQFGGKKKKRVKLVSAVRSRGTLDPSRNNGGPWVSVVPGGLPGLGKR